MDHFPRHDAMASARVAVPFYPYRPFFHFGQAKLPKNIARMKRLARLLQVQADERRR
jgi:hypothetical protein